MRVLRWVGIGLVTLVVVIAGAAISLYMVGGSKLRQTMTQQVEPRVIPDDSLSIAEGLRYANVFGCTACHGQRLEGKRMIDDAVIGRMIAPHLAPGAGSVTASFDTDDWVRAIRHGIGGDGRPLVIMPASDYAELLAEEDLVRIIAAISNADPVDNDPGRSRLRLGQAMIGAGMVKLEPALINTNATPPVKPDATDTLGTGRYLGGVCTTCHGKGLMGNEQFGGPPLVQGSAMDTYDAVAFHTLFRTGQAKNGRMLDNELMPWKELGHMTDSELRAVWAWIRSVEPTTPD